MKDVLSLLFSIYHAINGRAGNQKQAQRFLADIGSWGVYTLMRRLVSRTMRISERDDQLDAAYASIVAVGVRSGGPGWLDDQLYRTLQSLTSPTRRRKGLAEEREMSAAVFARSEALRRKAAEIASRSGMRALEDAERAAENWEGAQRTLMRLVTQTGCFDRHAEIDPALMDGGDLERAVQKCKDALISLAAYSADRGDHVDAALFGELFISDEFADICAPFEVVEEGGWVPPHELGSDDYRDQQDMARYHHELDEQYRENVVRTHAVR